jgi:hypothetical protein
MLFSGSLAAWILLFAPWLMLSALRFTAWAIRRI